MSARTIIEEMTGVEESEECKGALFILSKDICTLRGSRLLILSFFYFCGHLGNLDAPEFEFCIVTAKYMIECAAIRPVLAEVRRGDKRKKSRISPFPYSILSCSILSFYDFIL
jgi:hypothetical protein